jgi:hypothetical protein
MTGDRITHTSTRTFYWNAEHVEPIRVELEVLAGDLADRAKYIDAGVLRQAQERVDAVRLAIARLTDPVTDP